MATKLVELLQQGSTAGWTDDTLERVLAGSVSKDTDAGVDVAKDYIKQVLGQLYGNEDVGATAGASARGSAPATHTQPAAASTSEVGLGRNSASGEPAQDSFPASTFPPRTAAVGWTGLPVGADAAANSSAVPPASVPAPPPPWAMAASTDPGAAAATAVASGSAGRRQSSTDDEVERPRPRPHHGRIKEQLDLLQNADQLAAIISVATTAATTAAAAAVKHSMQAPLPPGAYARMHAAARDRPGLPGVLGGTVGRGLPVPVPVPVPPASFGALAAAARQPQQGPSGVAGGDESPEPQPQPRDGALVSPHQRPPEVSLVSQGQGKGALNAGAAANSAMADAPLTGGPAAGSRNSASATDDAEARRRRQREEPWQQRLGTPLSQPSGEGGAAGSGNGDGSAGGGSNLRVVHLGAPRVIARTPPPGRDPSKGWLRRQQQLEAEVGRMGTAVGAPSVDRAEPGSEPDGAVRRSQEHEQRQERPGGQTFPTSQRSGAVVPGAALGELGGLRSGRGSADAPTSGQPSGPGPAAEPAPAPPPTAEPLPNHQAITADQVPAEGVFVAGGHSIFARAGALGAMAALAGGAKLGASGGGAPRGATEAVPLMPRPRAELPTDVQEAFRSTLAFIADPDGARPPQQRQLSWAAMADVEDRKEAQREAEELLGGAFDYTAVKRELERARRSSRLLQAAPGAITAAPSRLQGQGALAGPSQSGAGRKEQLVRASGPAPASAVAALATGAAAGGRGPRGDFAGVLPPAHSVWDVDEAWHDLDEFSKAIEAEVAYRAAAAAAGAPPPPRGSPGPEATDSGPTKTTIQAQRLGRADVTRGSAPQASGTRERRTAGAQTTAKAGSLAGASTEAKQAQTIAGPDNTRKRAASPGPPAPKAPAAAEASPSSPRPARKAQASGPIRIAFGRRVEELPKPSANEETRRRSISPPGRDRTSWPEGRSPVHKRKAAAGKAKAGAAKAGGAAAAASPTSTTDTVQQVLSALASVLLSDGEEDPGAAGASGDDEGGGTEAPPTAATSLGGMGSSGAADGSKLAPAGRAEVVAYAGAAEREQPLSTGLDMPSASGVAEPQPEPTPEKRPPLGAPPDTGAALPPAAQPAREGAAAPAAHAARVPPPTSAADAGAPARPAAATPCTDLAPPAPFAQAAPPAPMAQAAPPAPFAQAAASAPMAQAAASAGAAPPPWLQPGHQPWPATTTTSTARPRFQYVVDTAHPPLARLPAWAASAARADGAPAAYAAAMTGAPAGLRISTPTRHRPGQAAPSLVQTLAARVAASAQPPAQETGDGERVFAATKVSYAYASAPQQLQAFPVPADPASNTHIMPAEAAAAAVAAAQAGTGAGASGRGSARQQRAPAASEQLEQALMQAVEDEVVSRLAAAQLAKHSTVAVPPPQDLIGMIPPLVDYELTRTLVCDVLRENLRGLLITQQRQQQSAAAAEDQVTLEAVVAALASMPAVPQVRHRAGGGPAPESAGVEQPAWEGELRHRSQPPLPQQRQWEQQEEEQEQWHQPQQGQELGPQLLDPTRLPAVLGEEVLQLGEGGVGESHRASTQAPPREASQGSDGQPDGEPASGAATGKPAPHMEETFSLADDIAALDAHSLQDPQHPLASAPAEGVLPVEPSVAGSAREPGVVTSSAATPVSRQLSLASSASARSLAAAPAPAEPEPRAQAASAAPVYGTAAPAALAPSHAVPPVAAGAAPRPALLQPWEQGDAFDAAHLPALIAASAGPLAPPGALSVRAIGGALPSAVTAAGAALGPGRVPPRRSPAPAPLDPHSPATAGSDEVVRGTSRAIGVQAHGVQARAVQAHGSEARGVEAWGVEARGTQAHGVQGRGTQAAGTQERATQAAGVMDSASQADPPPPHFMLQAVLAAGLSAYGMGQPGIAAPAPAAGLVSPQPIVGPDGAPLPMPRPYYLVPADAAQPASLQAVFGAASGLATAPYGRGEGSRPPLNLPGLRKLRDSSDVDSSTDSVRRHLQAPAVQVRAARGGRARGGVAPDNSVDSDDGLLQRSYAQLELASLTARPVHLERHRVALPDTPPGASRQASAAALQRLGLGVTGPSPVFVPAGSNDEEGGRADDGLTAGVSRHVGFGSRSGVGGAGAGVGGIGSRASLAGSNQGPKMQAEIAPMATPTYLTAMAQSGRSVRSDRSRGVAQSVSGSAGATNDGAATPHSVASSVRAVAQAQPDGSAANTAAGAAGAAAGSRPASRASSASHSEHSSPSRQPSTTATTRTASKSTRQEVPKNEEMLQGGGDADGVTAGRSVITSEPSSASGISQRSKVGTAAAAAAAAAEPAPAEGDVGERQLGVVSRTASSVRSEGRASSRAENALAPLHAPAVEAAAAAASALASTPAAPRGSAAPELGTPAVGDDEYVTEDFEDDDPDQIHVVDFGSSDDDAVADIDQEHSDDLGSGSPAPGAAQDQPQLGASPHPDSEGGHGPGAGHAAGGDDSQVEQLDLEDFGDEAGEVLHGEGDRRVQPSGSARVEAADAAAGLMSAASGSRKSSGGGDASSQRSGRSSSGQTASTRPPLPRTAADGIAGVREPADGSGVPAALSVDAEDDQPSVISDEELLDEAEVGRLLDAEDAGDTEADDGGNDLGNGDDGHGHEAAGGDDEDGTVEDFADSGLDAELTVSSSRTPRTPGLEGDMDEVEPEESRNAEAIDGGLEQADGGSALRGPTHGSGAGSEGPSSVAPSRVVSFSSASTSRRDAGESALVLPPRSASGSASGAAMPKSGSASVAEGRSGIASGVSSRAGSVVRAQPASLPESAHGEGSASLEQTHAPSRASSGGVASRLQPLQGLLGAPADGPSRPTSGFLRPAALLTNLAPAGAGSQVEHQPGSPGKPPSLADYHGPTGRLWRPPPAPQHQDPLASSSETLVASSEASEPAPDPFSRATRQVEAKVRVAGPSSRLLAAVTRASALESSRLPEGSSMDASMSSVTESTESEMLSLAGMRLQQQLANAPNAEAARLLVRARLGTSSAGRGGEAAGGDSGSESDSERSGLHSERSASTSVAAGRATGGGRERRDGAVFRLRQYGARRRKLLQQIGVKDPLLSSATSFSTDSSASSDGGETL